jgi:DHA1 family bicyclomycin/chloramphenicol resistance-like MFS transporter
MQIGYVRSAIVLGLLACIGPFSIDMYLPAMPAIARDLGSDMAGVQMTLSVYFLAFGLAQLVYGPLADMYGRRPPLYGGLALFFAGTVGCALAPTIDWLIALRFVQGVGGAAVMVIPRAIVRDLHTGPRATRLMSTIMLVISVSPMLAPLAGSGLVALAGWRLVFAALVGAAVVSFLVTTFALPETLKPENREPVDLAHLLRGSRLLLTSPYFMGLTFIGGFGMASFFVFLATASFVYTGWYGLTPTQFSLAFAVNAIGFFTASQFAANLGERFGMARTVLVAACGFAFFDLLLLTATLHADPSLPFLMAMLILGNACLGLVIPTAMVMALDDHGHIAGLASSLGGTLQMMAGAGMIALAGPFLDGTPRPMVTAIAVCATLTLVIALSVLRRRAAAQPCAAE